MMSMAYVPNITQLRKLRKFNRQLKGTSSIMDNCVQSTGPCSLKTECNASSKSIKFCLPAQSAQADMG